MARKAGRSDQKSTAERVSFMNGYCLGYYAGKIEAARELEAEFRNELENTRADALKIINETRRLVGLPPAEESLNGAPPLTMQ